MKNTLLKALAIGLILLALPMKQHGQEVKNHLIELEVESIVNPDYRFCLLSNIANDASFDYTVDDDNMSVLITSANHWSDNQFQSYFNGMKEESEAEFNAYLNNDKETKGDIFSSWKNNLPQDLFVLLFKQMLIENPIDRDGNQTCATSDPFCTTDVVSFHVEANPGGSCETGPYYGCLSPYTARPPFWFHMKIGIAGAFTIRMTNSSNVDIDYCCWGPFSDPVTPCPSQLTNSRYVDCGSSANHTETCNIPSTSQVGQYYIMVITKYNTTQATDITFQKVANSGPGETDCGILPPMVSNSGPYCVGETITLTGNAQAGASYSWSGPGGWTATGQTVTRPDCTTAMAGIYTCTIQIGSQTNSATTEVVINTPPTANFTASTVCKGTPTQFTNTSTSTPPNQQLTYLWNFGDGNTSNQASPSHQYATSGEFTVTLTAMANAHCSDSKSKTITVYSPPTADAGADQTIPYGTSATLSGSGGSGSGSGSYTYHWEPASLVVSPNAQVTPTIALQQSTTFTLTVVNPEGGCSGTDQVNVLISGSNMTATASASPTSICPGGTSQLRATASGGTGNYTYSWSPTIGLSAPNIANPVASPTETTTYSCIVSDGLGTQTVSTTVTVNTTEYEEETQYICPGETYTFYGDDYTEEGDYEYTTTTPQGCEKIITLHLRHYPTYNDTPSVVFLCHGDIYNFHGHQYDATGLYSETLETIHGCDSIVSLNLTVYPANDTTIKDPSICESQSYNFHGTYYSHDGDVAYFDTVDEHGCLKVEKLVLSVGAYQMPPTEEVFWCVPYGDTPSYTWPRNHVTYTQDTEDEVILPDPNGGCDFKYRLNLKFHQVFKRTETKVVCDSYEWPYTPGVQYTNTNHHIEQNFYGGGGPNFNCDSIYVLDLTVYKSNESEITKTNQCDSLRWHFGNNGESYLYTQSGDYTRTIQTTHGCDSTVTLHLKMDYRPDFERVEGNPWVVGGSEFQYTIEPYWIETNQQSTHSTEWGLYDVHGEPFSKWDCIPYDNGDKCMLYIYTFERDSVELRVQTRSTGDCDCGSYSDSKWIHCGYINVDETPSLCEADIYPNPNDGSMTLSFDYMVGEVEVKVYNINGTLVDRFTVHNGFNHQTHRYQTENLSGGVYFFNLAGKDVSITKKVIIID